LENVHPATSLARHTSRCSAWQALCFGAFEFVHRFPVSVSFLKNLRVSRIWSLTLLSVAALSAVRMPSALAAHVPDMASEFGGFADVLGGAANVYAATSAHGLCLHMGVCGTDSRRGQR